SPQPSGEASSTATNSTASDSPAGMSALIDSRHWYRYASTPYTGTTMLSSGACGGSVPTSPPFDDPGARPRNLTLPPMVESLNSRPAEGERRPAGGSPAGATRAGGA